MDYGRGIGAVLRWCRSRPALMDDDVAKASRALHLGRAELLWMDETRCTADGNGPYLGLGLLLSGLG